MLEIQKRARARSVLQTRKTGKTLKEIADNFNLSKPTVSKILKAAKEKYLLDKKYRSPKEKFLKKLRQKCKELNGLSPTMVDINEDERFEGSRHYVVRYGNWNKLLKEAGLKVNDAGNGTKRGYNPELDPEKAG